jgi:hypothetical protein
MMFTNFHSNGIGPHCSEWLNNVHILGAICCAHSFKSLDGKPLEPLVFNVFRPCKQLATLSTPIAMSDRFCFILIGSELSIVSSMTNGHQCLIEKR